MAPPRRRTKTFTPSPRQAQESSMAELTRQRFFKGRPDIPRERLERRRLQDEELKRFKQQYITDVPGATGIVQMKPGAPMSLAIS